MLRLRRYALWSAVAAMLLSLSATAFAQSPTGDIRGRLTDPSGAVVTGATVTITEVATGRKITVPTTDVGIYSALHLLPGSYTVTASAANFSPSSRGVVVQAGQVANIDLTVQVGKAQTTVEV